MASKDRNFKYTQRLDQEGYTESEDVTEELSSMIPPDQ